MAEEIFQMKKDGFLGYNFEMPRTIRAFREPSLIESSYTNKEW